MAKVAAFHRLFAEGSPSIVTAPNESKPARAPLHQLFRAGQLLELSGGRPGKLSTVASLIAHAQGQGEPVAWVGARDEAGFYPPDFVLGGIDLAALVVVRVPSASGPHALVRAAELLLRSGAFGLVTIDFGSAPVPRGELAWQARLSGLVRKHEARVVLITASSREAPSLGPLIALRVEPETQRDGARVVLTQHLLKSKLGLSDELGGVSPDVRVAPVGALEMTPVGALGMTPVGATDLALPHVAAIRL